VTAVFVATMLVAFGSLVFDALVVHWHYQDRKARAEEHERLEEDERVLGLRQTKYTPEDIDRYLGQKLHPWQHAVLRQHWSVAEGRFLPNGTSNDPCE
jgi:hypothetical protein